jgi:ubiquinone/menaquinone biosynthesis C-methylase UbiE
MVTRKLELRRRYDETAGFYDRRYEEIQRAKYRDVMKNLPDWSKRILDLGCGTGMFLNELSNRAKFVVGADASLEMLKLAKGRVREARLVQADADSLPFADGSFDAIVSVTLLQNMPDPEATVREVARVIKLGGAAVLTVLKRRYSREELEEWVKHAGMKLIGSGEIEGSEDVFCVAMA